MTLHPRIDGVILAGGLSKRFGRPKQLASFRGKPLVRHVAEAALGSKLRGIVLVTGHESESVKQSLAGVAAGARLRFVYNPEYQEGQAASIRHGIRALPEDCDAGMFLSCDQPLISSEYLNLLIAAFLERRPLICYPVFEGRRSNPTIFAASLFRELERLTGDVGGRVLIERYRSRAFEMTVSDPRRLADVDDEDDLRTLEGEAGPGG
ncbi:MAG: nucleotidyltransferase family protein [Acidobacteria bacterium]|nr:nucleotidyltransferase family protein [Acidobacteriota bacterium]